MMPSSKRDSDQELFGKERLVLRDNQARIKMGPGKDNQELWETYQTLCRHYESLLKVSIKLTKVSDATQRKLMHAKEEIDKRTQELAEKNEALYHTSVTDHLTGIFNRMYLMEALKREFSASRRHGHPLSCAIMDIDKFKNFNDAHGHLTGDLVLRETATMIQSQLREQDVFGRYGGEEFLLILSGTSVSSAAKVAEKIRETVEKAVFDPNGKKLSVTLSFGVADIETDFPGSMDEMIQNADSALYQAKAAGRNRVMIFMGQQGDAPVFC